MNTDEHLREAFAHLADQAPDPDRIRAGLPTRAGQVHRATRRRTLGACAAMAAVVLGVGAVSIVPRLLASVATPPRAAAQDASIQPAASAPGPQVKVTVPGMPLRFVPTWLPDGLRERERDTTAKQQGGDVSRVWLPVSSGSRSRGTITPQLEFGVTSGTFHGCMSGQVDKPGTMVQVGGAPGCLSSGTRHQLAWQLAPDTIGLLTPQNKDWDTKTLLRVATSVRPDSTLLPIPLRPNSLPGGRTVAAVIAEGTSATDWHTRVRTASSRTGASALRSLDVSIGTWSEAIAGGQKLTVTIAGVTRQARLVGEKLTDGGWVNYLAVDLDGGRLLTLTAVAPADAAHDPATKKELVRIAQNVQIDEAALDLSWLRQ